MATTAATMTTHKFTVDEYYRMAEAGILARGQRVELVEGEIVDMAPIGRKHASCVDRLTDAFAPLYTGGPLCGCRGRCACTSTRSPSPTS